MTRAHCEVRSLSFDDLDVDIKAKPGNDTGWSIDGYASIFNTKDFYRDIIRPKAYNKTIKERKNRIKVLWQHDAEQPMGMPEEMKPDEKGLWTRSNIPFTTRNKDRMDEINAGLVDGLSVGFLPEEYKYIEDEDEEPEDDFFFWPVREITKILLLEYSPVTIPGHDDARMVGTQKSLAISTILQKGGRSDLASMITGASLKEVSADLLEEMLGYLGAVYKSRTGLDFQMPTLTPDDIRSAALNWKNGNGLYLPQEKASVTVQVDVDEPSVGSGQIANGSVGSDDIHSEEIKPQEEGETTTPQDGGETPDPGNDVEERDLDNLMAALNDLEIVPRGARTEEKDLQKLMETLERIGD